MTNNPEEELTRLEEELKALESMEGTEKSDYGSPKPLDKETMFKFFTKILELPESWKVGNLKEEEIGICKLGVRSYLELSRYAEAEGLELVQSYFTDKADIVAAPTMGRKGFLAQLFVTHIRKDQKLKEPSSKQKGWFRGKTNETEQ